MTPDAVAALATVILLFPMGYFLLASPAFLFVRLDIEPVALLLRGLFKAHFIMMGIVGVVGMIAFVVAGRPGFAVGIGLIVAFAVWAGPWFLRQMDAQINAGDAGSARWLRRLHWGGMLCNAVQVFALVASIPYMAPLP